MYVHIVIVFANVWHGKPIFLTEIRFTLLAV